MCTHKQKYSQSSTDQTQCQNYIKDKTSCLADTKCMFTESYFPIATGNGKRLNCNDYQTLATFASKTPETCDTACVMDRQCLYFA